MTTGEKIAKGRKSLGATQEQFAEMLSVSSQAVSNWERDKNMPDLGKLNQIAEKIGISVSNLIGENDASLDFEWDLKGVQYSEERMFTRLKAVAESKGLTQTYRALYFAKTAHSGQLRKKQKYALARSNYIVHPLEMACHLLSLGITEDELLAVSLLHDVCEDCDCKPEDLPFSQAVQDSVRILTKPMGKEESNEAYYEAISLDRIASVVKLVDRCNNVSTMAQAFSNEKMNEYITETEKYVLPLIKTVKKSWPEYADLTFLVKYQIVSVIETIKVMLLASRG
jgi:GTP pyrophosphokinase